MGISTADEPDSRQQQLEEWVAQQLGVDRAAGEAASSDASFRRYFRFSLRGQSLIAMDAPPASEDCRPFVAIAELFRLAKVNVPQVVARDLENGFLLLSDLGRQTYLDVLTDANADALFDDAIDALLRIQLASRPGVLPVYDEALLRRELALFPDWYLRHHLGMSPDAKLQAALDHLFDLLVQRALAQTQVFVHRDFMPRNLMISEPNPGVLDFQDAVWGPVSYDPVCLFKDAFLSWPRDRVTGWLALYWRRARECGLPVADQFDDFQIDCDWMGAQRHLKVIGIFARICYRDGKSRYLEDAPRFFGYLEEVARCYPELTALREVLDAVGRASEASRQ